jgi:hypothetical protein
MWPVHAPPKDKATLHVNLGLSAAGTQAVKPLPPGTVYDGPLNVLIGLHGVAASYVNVANVKQAYDGIAPTPGTSPVTREIQNPLIDE